MSVFFAATLFAVSVSTAPTHAVLSGTASFFAPSLGACGLTSTSTDLIVAVAAQVFDTFPGADPANPNLNPICGKRITAHSNGKTVKATIVDRCVACMGPDDLDFSPAAFSVLASVDLGRVPVTWVLA
ncbi:loosenin [Artomyces pyxidatus]|uniref:Loosenin n=1 Tax=Artomyces pyxidatus TaxID=48021 RepID=A0ACB8SKG5_9AGAM|nr:loosenin [Artomyces pyxidatus]